MNIKIFNYPNMKKLFAILFFIATALSSVAQHERDKGLSLHMLPERVAKLSNEKGGFTVSAPIPIKQSVAMDAKEVMQYFNESPEAVRRNGIWIVFTNPSSYSEAEKEQLKRLIADCKQKSIPIYTCRANELNRNGWKAGGVME